MGNNLLKQISDQMEDIIKTSMDRVVHIGGDEIPFRTGFWLDGKTIVTTALAVNEGESISALDSESNKITATVRAFDTEREIVVLTPDKEREIPIMEGLEPKLGGLAVILANPSPDGVEARLDMIRIAKEDYFQTDGLSFPGFSGAMVLSPEGKLNGIINSNATGNYGQAIPYGKLMETVEKLKTAGSSKKRLLGIMTQEVEKGLLVLEVVKNSAAEKAGLLVGDILTKLNSTPLESNYALLAGLETTEGEITLSVNRGGKEKSIKATPDEKIRTYKRRRKHKGFYGGHSHCCP